MRLASLLALLGAALAALALPKAVEVKVGEVSPAVWYSWRELGRTDVQVTGMAADPLRTVWTVRAAGTDLLRKWDVNGAADKGMAIVPSDAHAPDVPAQGAVCFAGGATLFGREVMAVGGVHVVEGADGRAVVQRDVDAGPLGRFAACVPLGLGASQAAMLRDDAGRWSLVTSRDIISGFDGPPVCHASMRDGQVAFVCRIGGVLYGCVGKAIRAKYSNVSDVLVSRDGSHAAFVEKREDGWYVHTASRTFGPYVGDAVLAGLTAVAFPGIGSAPSNDGEHVGVFIRRGETIYAYQDMRNLGPVGKDGTLTVDDQGRPVYRRDAGRDQWEHMVGDRVAVGPVPRGTMVLRTDIGYWRMGPKSVGAPGGYVTDPHGTAYGPYDWVSGLRVSADSTKWAFTAGTGDARTIHTHTGVHGPYESVSGLTLNVETGHWMALVRTDDRSWRVLQDGAAGAAFADCPMACPTTSGASTAYAGQQPDGLHIGMTGGKDYRLDAAERPTVLLVVADRPAAIIPRTVEGRKVDSLWIAGEWLGDYDVIQAPTVIGNALHFAGWREGVLYWVKQAAG